MQSLHMHMNRIFMPECLTIPILKYIHTGDANMSMCIMWILYEFVIDPIPFEAVVKYEKDDKNWCALHEKRICKYVNKDPKCASRPL